MKWNIVTDSSCDLMPAEALAGQVKLSSVPFIIRIDDQDYIDDETLDVRRMVDAMEQSAHASRTACPSPQSWAEQFEQAEQSIAITISSNLSGSMNSAVLARELVLEDSPEKKIAVLDSRSTGPELAMCVEKIVEWIASGARFEQVVQSAKAYFEKLHVVFALSSFDNLVKNGRMGRIAGFLARKLGMWGIGIGSDEGTIAIKGKTVGAQRALALLTDVMKENRFEGGRVTISHCMNPTLAQALKERITQLWSGTQVKVLPTRGLCSYYAERGGLIVSY